ncbi:MAG: hypothetical protein IPJ65_01800 [Archangiaceae bacterium]|nr:hypothetical protein [Archangiaceae bacterium]
MAGAPRIPPTRSNSPAPAPAPSRGQQVATGVATAAAGSAYQSQAAGSESSGDATKDMIFAYIWSQLKKMMEEAGQKLQEAMKKKG